ncbi:hypothetical protein JIN85_01525 [Luteolibacter pohnpeiensis]|uniref:PEP-CTERM protein-sorting domain-containing protein n=1 Tax=Luteolibacter pohnpeiensis TaxID=454153 RepID=A0A934S2D6_9BACT|nr:hypothetical protein [Luteolibacter pohnpeiensis]MBK1881072.1 hypothetical protein [Luteolibacter pohnpeiensis]
MKHHHCFASRVKSISSSKFIGAAFSLSTLLFIQAANAADITWTGATSDVFNLGTNWSSGTVPGSSDNALLAAGTAVFNDGSTISVGYLSSTTGSLTIGSGTLNLISTSSQQNFGNNGGTLNMTGGTLNIASAFVYRIGASSSTATTFTMSGASAVNTTGGSYFVIGNGILNGGMSDTASISSSASNFYFGDSAGTVNFTMSGSSKLNSSAGTFVIANGGSTNTTLSLTDSASINVTGGTLKIASGGSSTGTLTLSDDSYVNVTSTNAVIVGGGGGSTASVTLNGNSYFNATKIKMGDAGTTASGSTSSITLNDSSTMTLQQLTVGHYSGGGTSTVTVNTGAKLTASSYVTLGRDDSATGTAVSSLINLNGGVLETQYVQNGSGTGTHLLTVDGGTVRALASVANFFPAGMNGSSAINTITTPVTIAAGGMTFDTNGFNVGIGTVIDGSGGLNKIGAGDLTINSALTYTGETYVTEGSLSVGATGSLATSLISVASGSILSFDTGSGLTNLTTIELASSTAVELFYDGDMTLESLTLDGVEVDPGTYTISELNALGSSSSITFTSDAFNATLSIIPEPGCLTLTAFAGMLLLRRSRRA